MLKKRILCFGLSLFLLTACGTQTSKEADAYRQYGINCLEGGKYEDAIDSFQKALDRSLGHIGELELDICFYKARAHYLNGEPEEALSIYQAIIDYNEDARAYYLRGLLNMDLGKTQEAVLDFEKVTSIKKEDYEMYLGIYDSLMNHGKPKDAATYLQKAKKIKGDSAKDYLYQGRIAYLEKDYNLAIEKLLKAKEKELPIASYYLGLAYNATGNKELAESFIKQYLDSGIATSYDLYQLGSNESMSGNYVQAAVYFEAGLKMENVPNKQNLMKGAISAYEYSGDFAAAKKMMDEYLKLYPSDEDAAKEAVFLGTR